MGQESDELGSQEATFTNACLCIISDATVDSDKRMWVQETQEWGQLEKTFADWFIFLFSLPRIS